MEKLPPKYDDGDTNKTKQQAHYLHPHEGLAHEQGKQRTIAHGTQKAQTFFQLPQ